MKLLILCNYFQSYNRYLPKIVVKYLDYYNSLKLNSLIKKLQKNYNQNLIIKIINGSDKSIVVNPEIEVQSLSRFRLSLDHQEFLKIKNDIIKQTKRVLLKFYKNLIENRLYNYKGIFFPKLFEFHLYQFLNEIFGNFEVLKRLLVEEKFDNLILFNCNRYSVDFFQLLNSNSKSVLVFNDNLFLKNNRILSLLSSINYIIIASGIFIKNHLLKSRYRNRKSKNEAKKNIIFFANSKNQINSVKPVYSVLKKTNTTYPIYYSSQIFLRINNLIKMLRYAFWSKKILKNHKIKIFKDIEYDSVNLENVFMIFYYNRYIVDKIKLFNVINNFIVFITRFTPSLVIITNDFLPSMRMIANYSKTKNIPTLYIPHAAIPVIDEMVTKNDVEYFVLGGEFDKKYYIKKGIVERNIEVSGVPRYEYFYKKEIHNLDEITDRFNYNQYQIERGKFTILLTTNPIDDESNEKILTIVIECLKELNLINNLIIKLHPREDGAIHKKITRKLKVDPIIVKDYQILDLIKSCDLLLSQKSTTILESMLVGTPVVLLDFINKSFKETSKYLFLDENFVKSVRDKQSLIQLIKNLYSNKKMRENYIKNLLNTAEHFIFYNSEQPPITKISEIILKLIKE